MSRPIEGEQPGRENILRAAESILGEARDLNRTYPTTLKFRTAEIFRNEVAKFTAGRRALRHTAEAVERGEEIHPLLAIVDGFARRETGEGVLPSSEQQRKNDNEYVAENLLPKLIDAVPIQRKTFEEMSIEILEQMSTGIDPEADRTVTLELSEREVDFLKKKARSSIHARESWKEFREKSKYFDDAEVKEDHIRELEKAFSKVAERQFQIENLTKDQIPGEVMGWFERRSAMLIHPQDYIPGNFTGFYVIHHLRGDATYAARQVKKYSTDGTVEDLVHLIDVNENQAERGHGELRRNISSDEPYFKHKPFVGFTETRAGLRHQGLGTRRLYMMNQFSQMLYELPLCSSTEFADEEAKKIWEGLVNEGKATKYMEGDLDRFKFT